MHSYDIRLPQDLPISSQGTALCL
ncbi:hypothetical protein [Dictyobacter kobayashii]